MQPKEIAGIRYCIEFPAGLATGAHAFDVQSPGGNIRRGLMVK